MVVRISDKTQNYSKVTKLLVKPSQNKSILQQMREMSGKAVSIDEMNRSAGHEKEMNRSR